MQVIFTNELSTDVFDISFFQLVLQKILKLQEKENEPLSKN